MGVIFKQWSRLVGSAQFSSWPYLVIMLVGIVLVGGAVG